MKKYAFVTFIFLAFTIPTNNSLPPVNAKIIEFVKSVMGKQVGRGECWDLAAEALDYAGAKWEAPFGFGKKYNYKSAKIFPGDIIQVSNVTMERRTTNEITRWKMLKHTAVVYEVKSNSEIIVAEQNVDGVKKVMTNAWNLNDLKTGTMDFYRPEAE